MFTCFNSEVHFLHKLPLQTISCSFAKLQPTAGKFGDIAASNEFIADQHLLLFINKNAINS